MNFLVIGTGSIGTRHIRNLKHLGHEVSAYSYRLAENPEIASRDDIERVGNLTDALQDDYDAVVIANRTDQHIDVAIEAAKSGRNLFVEKPLSISMSGVEALLDLEKQNRLVVEIGFMLKFHPNLQWIKENLHDAGLGEILYVNAQVGQWLPDWRPGTDHRQGYGAFRKTGGGVIFDLIHELDLVHWLFGDVHDVTAMTGYVDALEIETEAIANIGLRMDSGILARVQLDYVRPLYGRDLEIVGTEGILQWDYSKEEVSLSGRGRTQEVVHRADSDFERNTMFLEHMAHFSQRLTGNRIAAGSSLDAAAAVERIALAAHRSAEERRCVRPREIDETYHIKGSY